MYPYGSTQEHDPYQREEDLFQEKVRAGRFLPPTEEVDITFVVLGVAAPGGSKRAMPIYRGTASGYKELVTREDGSPVIAVTDANPNVQGWKTKVAEAARRAYQGPLLDGPLFVQLAFVRPRPKSHFGKTGLNKTGRKYNWPTGRPDVLKLARAVEDSLVGVIYRDDSQIVRELLLKEWGEPARVEITIREL